MNCQVRCDWSGCLYTSSGWVTIDLGVVCCVDGFLFSFCCCSHVGIIRSERFYGPDHKAHTTWGEGSGQILIFTFIVWHDERPLQIAVSLFLALCYKLPFMPRNNCAPFPPLYLVICQDVCNVSDSPGEDC